MKANARYLFMKCLVQVYLLGTLFHLILHVQKQYCIVYKYTLLFTYLSCQILNLLKQRRNKLFSKLLIEIEECILLHTEKITFALSTWLCAYLLSIGITHQTITGLFCKLDPSSLTQNPTNYALRCLRLYTDDLFHLASANLQYVSAAPVRQILDLLQYSNK